MDNAKSFPLLICYETQDGKQFRLLNDVGEIPMDVSVEYIAAAADEGMRKLAVKMYNKGWAEAETAFAEAEE